MRPRSRRLRGLRTRTELRAPYSTGTSGTDYRPDRYRTTGGRVRSRSLAAPADRRAPDPALKYRLFLPLSLSDSLTVGVAVRYSAVSTLRLSAAPRT